MLKTGILSLAFTLILVGSAVHGQEPEPMASGTTKALHYTATKLGIPILKATVTFENERGDDGKPLLSVCATFRSLRYLDSVFRMNNRFTSTVVRETCEPVRYLKEVDQGGLLIPKRNYTHTISFDSSLQRVVLERKGTGESEVVSLPPHTYDPLSMFARYYLSKERIPVGEDLRMAVYDGVKLRQILFHSRKERVKSKVYGDVEAICLESAISFSTFGEKEGVLRIWYLAEEERVPLFMELELPVGSVRFELDGLEKE